MSEEIQNEEIVVEDVQEEDLVENQELVQDTPEEVAEESQESLSDSVLVPKVKPLAACSSNTGVSASSL